MCCSVGVASWATAVGLGLEDEEDGDGENEDEDDEEADGEGEEVRYMVEVERRRVRDEMRLMGVRRARALEGRWRSGRGVAERECLTQEGERRAKGGIGVVNS